MHQHFLCSLSGELFCLLLRERQSKTGQTVRQMSQNILQARCQCKELSVKLFRFWASILPNRLIFNYEVAVSLMRLEEMPVEHFVDTHTSFQIATV